MFCKKKYYMKNYDEHFFVKMEIYSLVVQLDNGRQNKILRENLICSVFSQGK